MVYFDNVEKFSIQIPPSPPRRSKLCIACSDFYFKNRSALTPLLLLSKSNPLRWALIWFFFSSRRDLNPLSSPSGFAAKRRERVGTLCTKCRQALQIPPSPPKNDSPNGESFFHTVEKCFDSMKGILALIAPGDARLGRREGAASAAS